MKRYELAKRQGLNWQAVLISDAETDLKVLVRNLVMQNSTYAQVNAAVNDLLNETVTALESEELKRMFKSAFYFFASKIYLQWVSLFGTRRGGEELLLVMSAQNKQIPARIKESLVKLPEAAFINRATPNMTYNREYEKLVRQKINLIAEMTAKEDYSSRFSLRAAAERQIRYEWHEKQLKDLRDKGVKLVWIVPHANCSVRCRDFQGRLYSLDGTSGIQDGIPYEPLSVATDVYDRTKSGKVYKNGCLSGFNCRHTTREYKKGYLPEIIPESIIERQRAIDKRQRELERTVRIYEERAALSKGINGGSVKYKGKMYTAYGYYKVKAAEWTEEYKAYSRKNDVAFYPSRLDI